MADQTDKASKASGNAQDDDLINNLLNDPEALNDLLSKENANSTVKAADAVDYEDIDDDDLADDEDAPVQSANKATNGGLPTDNDLDAILGVGGTNEQDLDDLFGDDAPGGPAGVDMSFDFEDEETRPHSSDTVPDREVHGAGFPTSGATDPDAFDYEQARVLNGLHLLLDPDNPPAPPENEEEVFKAMWPTFRPDMVPKFQSLFPTRPAYYIGKTPLKPPKPFQPTKIHLDLAPDQAKAFRAPSFAKLTALERSTEAEQKGLVAFIEEDSGQDSDEDDIELEDKMYEEVGGVSWEEMQLICQDWEFETLEPLDSPPELSKDVNSPSDDLFGGDWDKTLEDSAPKRRKVAHPDASFYLRPAREVPSFDDPLAATAKLARRVILDSSDPDLLFETIEPSQVNNRKRPFDNLRQAMAPNVVKDISSRYNLSNDSAYDTLTKSHQSKVRSDLGTLTVKHSLPALKLQYPFYKVELNTKEARSFHRPSMEFAAHGKVFFQPPKRIKNKHRKGKDIQEVFDDSHSLTLGDNSHVVLLEYSEEHPTVISNVGMGNRLINYYRKKNATDTETPKYELGETKILFPHDKSPFDNFGTVDPGEIVPTLYNSMYRAPLYKHTPKSTDFLVIRSSTGVHGKQYTMRNIDHLYIAGQEFPFTEVPGTHSRKVTTAQKNRMKMIAYRQIYKNNMQGVRIEDITRHIRDSTDMQNRQKLKEFLTYDKDNKWWSADPKDLPPPGDAIRNMIKPEDVCLIDSMQVGLRHLQDAGYAKDNDIEDDEAKEGDSLEEQLAPWNTTKNFIGATQGKTMLQLHGEGDPTGSGLGFSFLKVSMKGGFKPLGESVEDKLNAKNNGHNYNVAAQNKAYEDTIQRIWGAQKASLSADVELEGLDMDDIHAEGNEAGHSRSRSQAATPGPTPHHGDDETGTQFSSFSQGSQRGKVLRIKRMQKTSHGKTEPMEEIVRNPKVIREYIRRREAMEMNNLEYVPISDLISPQFSERC